MRTLVASAAAILAAACVSASRVGARQLDSTPSDRVVSARELATYADLPADEALARVRPAMLREDYRGDPVEIYIDGRPGSGAALHEVPAHMVAEVRMLTPVEAALEYGPYHKHAVLVVTLVHGTNDRD